MDRTAFSPEPAATTAAYAPVPGPPPRRPRRWPYPVFFLLSVYTMLVSASGPVEDPDSIIRIWPFFAIILDPLALAHGLPYAAWLVAILGCHEMGHYLVCRYYRIEATPPLFLPGPVFPFGTLGAFIRIRSPFPDRNSLFDVGVAGPLAGFVVTVPALLYGIARSEIVIADGTAGIELGDSLLLLAMTLWVAPSVPEGHTLLLHPAAYAGWVGMFATALNLLPIGQLDGGHVMYAVSGRVHRSASILALGGLAALGTAYYFPWVFTAGLLGLLLGARHPRLLDEAAPLSAGRRLVALISFLIFLLCFMPTPFAGIAHGLLNRP